MRFALRNSYLSHSFDLDAKYKGAPTIHLLILNSKTDLIVAFMLVRFISHCKLNQPFRE